MAASLSASAHVRKHIYQTYAFFSFLRTFQRAC